MQKLKRLLGNDVENRREARVKIATVDAVDVPREKGELVRIAGSVDFGLRRRLRSGAGRYTSQDRNLLYSTAVARKILVGVVPFQGPLNGGLVENIVQGVEPTSTSKSTSCRSKCARASSVPVMFAKVLMACSHSLSVLLVTVSSWPSTVDIGASRCRLEIALNLDNSINLRLLKVYLIQEKTE